MLGRRPGARLALSGGAATPATCPAPAAAEQGAARKTWLAAQVTSVDARQHAHCNPVRIAWKQHTVRRAAGPSRRMPVLSRELPRSLPNTPQAYRPVSQDAPSRARVTRGARASPAKSCTLPAFHGTAVAGRGGRRAPSPGACSSPLASRSEARMNQLLRGRPAGCAGASASGCGAGRSGPGPVLKGRAAAAAHALAAAGGGAGDPSAPNSGLAASVGPLAAQSGEPGGGASCCARRACRSARPPTLRRRSSAREPCRLECHSRAWQSRPLFLFARHMGSACLRGS